MKWLSLNRNPPSRDFVKDVNAYLDSVMDAVDDPRSEPMLAWAGAIGDWPKIVYGIYDEVWKKQGKQETAEFVRVICRDGIIPGIDCFCQKVKEQLKSTADPGELSSLIKFHAERYKEEWTNKCAIEAHEFRYVRGVPAEVNPDPLAPPEIETKPEREAADTESFQGGKPNPLHPNRYGGKETAIVSYHKDDQRKMRVLARMLSDKPHIRYGRGAHRWFDSP